MKLFKYLLLGLFLTIGGITEAQFGTRFPTNVRYIAGGYINQRPFFRTLREALNDVKATASATNPFTFWVASDTTFIADWDSVYNGGQRMSDSVSINYVATGKIKWMGLNTVTTIHFVVSDSAGFIVGMAEYDNLSWDTTTGTWEVQSLADLKELIIDYITPEQYQPAIQDDATAIEDAITASLTSGLPVLFTQEYDLLTKVAIDLQGNDLTLLFTAGARITSSLQTSTGNIYIPDAIFTLSHGKKVVIDGLNIQANKTGILPGLSYNQVDINSVDDTANFLCAFKIDSTEEVSLSNVKATNAIYAGLFMTDVDHLYAENCIADSNYYAGMIVRRTLYSLITGGEYSYNGIGDTSYIGLYNYGYGLQFGNSFSDTYGRANEEATVTGIKAFNNVRDGIGAHQIYNLIVQGNHIKGFGNTGIWSVNNGYEMWVKDVDINHNIIEQDSAWYMANAVQAYYPMAIQVGTYADDNDQTDYSAGTIIVDHNIIKNLTPSATNWGIQSFGSFADNISITNNEISNSRFRSAAIGIGSGMDEGGQPKSIRVSGNMLNNLTINGATGDNECSILILAGKQVNMSDNILTDCVANDTLNAGIKVVQFDTSSHIEMLNINNNSIGGTFRNGIFIYNATAANINNNVFEGTFTDSYIYATPQMQSVLFNNFVKDFFIITGTDSLNQSNLLPNVLGNGIGNATYAIQTADSGNVSLNTITLDMLRYENITATFDIRVYVTGYGNVVGGYIEYYAYAGNADSVTAYGIDTVATEQYYNTSVDDFIDYCPTLSWVVNGTEATLKFAFPTTYTGYKIDINFNSRLAVIYQKPE